MPILHALVPAALTLCIAAAPVAPPPTVAPTEAVEPVPADPAAPAPAEVSTDPAEAAPADVAPPAEAPPPSEAPPPAADEPVPTVEAPVAETVEPQPPPPVIEEPAPLVYVDAEAQERMRKGQRIMNVSGIVMASGGALIVVGIIAALAAGRAPNVDDYQDIDVYRDDSLAYQRRAIAGSILSAVGGLLTIGGAIAFAAGGGRYLRGKKKAGQMSLTPTGAVRF